jgi:hypothetical protein
LDKEQEFLKQADNLLSTHLFWGTGDFLILQTLLWGAILCSSAAALCTATGKGDKWLVALLAAVPALALTVESTFSFSARYQFHDKSAAIVQRIRNDYVIRNDPVDVVSNKLDEFRESSQLPASKLSLGDRIDAGSKVPQANQAPPAPTSPKNQGAITESPKAPNSQPPVAPTPASQASK